MLAKKKEAKKIIKQMFEYPKDDKIFYNIYYSEINNKSDT